MQSKDVLKTKSQEEKNHYVFLSHFSLSVLLNLNKIWLWER